MTILKRVNSTLNQGVSMFGAIMVLLMIAHITISVVMRYVFVTPLSGSIVIVSYYYMIFVVFLPLGKVEEDRSHISVEILYSMTGGVLRTVIDVLTPLICLVITAMLSWRTGAEFISQFKEGTGVFEGDIYIMLWPTYAALPVGFALLTLTILINLLDDFHDRFFTVEQGEPQ